MRADSILGDDADPRFSGRRRHHVDIGWGDAAKQRQLVIADSGLEVRLMLPRGTFLADGAVIADDGHEIVVVRRPSEPAAASGARRSPRTGSSQLRSNSSVVAAPALATSPSSITRTATAVVSRSAPGRAPRPTSPSAAAASNRVSARR